MHSRHFLQCGDGLQGEEEDQGSPPACMGDTVGRAGQWGGQGVGPGLMPPSTHALHPHTAAANMGEQQQQQQQQQQHSDFAGHRRRGGFTADDFKLDDPYHEDGGSSYVSALL